MNALYFYLFLLVHPYIAMWWKSFELAGRKSWEALIPGYNYFVAFRLGANKPWWSLLMIFPGVHLVMWASANVSYIRRFGYFSLVDTLQGIFFPYIIMAKIAQNGDPVLPETNWSNSKQVGEREWGDHLVLFLCLPVIGHAIALGIAAVTRAKPGKKTKVKEWGDSLLFALVAASVIRTYVFEPFQIPTGSMEKTLLVGDFLFVNKLAYGPKVPVTPLSYPLVHNTVPLVNVRSYTDIEKLDYTRLPGFSKIERYDVVVFNYPAGDTSIYDPRIPHGLMGHNYHDWVNKEATYLWEKSKMADIQRLQGQFPNEDPIQKCWEQLGSEFFNNIDYWKNIARKNFAEEKLTHNVQSPTGKFETVEHYGVIARPVDKRENYIKRCVGIAGDFIEIKDAILWVNDAPSKYKIENQNLMYFVYSDSVTFSTAYFDGLGLEAERGDYSWYSSHPFDRTRQQGGYLMHLTASQKAKLEKKYAKAHFDLRIEKYVDDSKEPTFFEMKNNLHCFPNDPYISNTTSNFHRFQVPMKGQTMKINKDNIAWYRRIITAYEGHTLKETAEGIFIDGKKTDTYTFAMNYYWMMGDNRYNSADSRMWGFVPEDHIVGKASMVWFSKSAYKGIRWDRLFNVIE